VITRKKKEKETNKRVSILGHDWGVIFEVLGPRVYANWSVKGKPLHKSYRLAGDSTILN
jgi:hypothetical protein